MIYNTKTIQYNKKTQLQLNKNTIAYYIVFIYSAIVTIINSLGE